MEKRQKKSWPFVWICASALIHGVVYGQGGVKLMAGDPAIGNTFGQAVSISGSFALIGSPGDGDVGLSSGSAYVFMKTATGWIQEAKLIGSDVTASDLSGLAVSLSGSSAVVAASFHDEGGVQNAGAAYVFIRTGSGWVQEAKLTPSDPPAASDFFGNAVAIDGNLALIGAANRDEVGTNSGVVYVFARTGASWAQEAKLIPSDAAVGDFFGHAVSLSGNFALVGAKGKNSMGAAYVFERMSSGWVQNAKLTSSDLALNDLFGNSVSISGSYAVVGAPFADPSGKTLAGKAYVFENTSSGWIEAAKLIASDAGEKMNLAMPLASAAARPWSGRITTTMPDLSIRGRLISLNARPQVGRRPKSSRPAER